MVNGCLRHLPTGTSTAWNKLGARIHDFVVETLSHVEFKKLTASTKAIVRTGEFTPFANVILVAGAWGFKL